MKKYVLILVLMLLGATGTYAQNSLLQTIATPAGTAGGGNYRAGDVFSITYTANFSLIDGAQTQIDVVYDADILQLTNPNIIASSGVFNLPTTVPISGATIAKRYRTDPYTASYSFLGATTFTLTFRVRSVLCGIPAQNIKVELSTLNPPPTVTNLQVVSTTITIDNTAADASVVVDLINGSSCMGTALYRITTVGRIDAPQDKLYLSMPAGATVSAVYNSGGAEVTAVSTVPVLIFYSPLVATLASGGHDHWTYWDRDPTSELQVHYVMVNFAGGMCGGTISVNFVNSRLCFLEDAIVATPMNLAPCPCPSVDPGTGVISVGDSVGNGVVIVSKTFSTSNPLQYFCGANNCREHQYIVTVSNVSPLNLNNFELRDYLASLNISAGAGAIMVTGMAVSLTPFGPATAAEVFDFVPTPTTASVLISPGITADGIYHNIYTPDPINGIWPPATNATWNISGGALGLTVLPAYTTVRLRISHRLNDCPSPLADPLVNTAGVNFSAGSSSYSRTVSNTRTVNDAAVPVITAAKAVRKDGTVNYASSITAAPGETVEFKITIRNYGMAPGSVIVNDALFNPSATCSDLMAMGMYPDMSTFKVEDNTTDASGAAVSVYSTTALDAIRTALGSLGTTGFTSTPIVIEAASSCSAISELVISYKALLPTDPCCGFQNRNSVTLTDPGSGATIDQTRTAIVTADRFKYIELKLEATCNPADDSSWVSTTIDARPGQNIYYRASIRNNNNYPLSNLRMMVQLPSGDAGATNVSTHNSDPIVTLTSGASPAGYGFWGTGPVGIVSSVPAVPVPFYQPSLEENWLSTTPLSPTPTGKAIYATGIGLTGSVGGVPGEEYVIRYTIVTPVVVAGSSFNTAMGVGLAAGTECPFVASTNLLLHIVDSNACDSGALWCNCTITGDSSICVGCMGTTLYGCDSGTWSTDCTSIATVGSSSGVVSGHAAGTAIITYTSPDGCISVIVITVNPVPTMCSASICSICSGTLFSYNPTSTTPGATFEWNRPMVPGISNPAASGTGNPNEVLINTTTSPVVVAYVYTVTANGCSSTQTVNVTVIPGVVNTYTVTGGGNYCAGAPCPSIGLSGSDPGVSYQLYCGATATGAPVIGSGGALSLGSYCGPCVYSVLATNTATLCTLPMTGSVTVNEYPACSITGTNVICVGNMTNLTTSCAGGIWSSSMPGVGSVNPSTGQVIGISEGVTTIAYTSANGCISTYSVTVNSFPATPVISGGPLFVCFDGNATFTASPSPGTWMLFGPTYGTLVPTSPYFGNSVTFTGGIFPGVQSIYYMYSNSCGTSLANVNVTVGVLPAITGPSTLCVGTSVTEYNEDTCGTWTSSNADVASVGSVNGIVNGNQAGTATITFTNCSGCYTVKTITVNEACAITGSTSICMGTPAVLSACDSGSWYNGGSPCVAVSGGVVTGLSAPCAATITYMSTNGCISTTTVSVSVCDSPCVCVITGDSVICVGATSPLMSNCDSGTWSSSNVAIASVHPFTGMMGGISEGTAVITYISPTGCISTFTVTVLAPTVVVIGTTTTLICVGGSTTFSSTTTGGIWSSANTGVAIVGSGTGLVFGTGVGTTVITYVLSSPCGTIYTTVNVTVESTVGVINGPGVLCAGSDITLSDTTICGDWSSSDDAVATVTNIDGTSQTVRGVSAGVVHITFTNCSGCYTVKTITVNEACAITGSTSICMGTPAVLSACDSGSWYNGGSPCVSVSGGVVTGLSAPCAATITYMSASGCISTTTVSVTDCDSTECGCTLTGDVTLCVGDYSLISGCDSGFWSSGNPAVASVNFLGGVTGNSAGVTVISHISPTGCVTTINVMVYAPPTVCVLTGGGSMCEGECHSIALTCSDMGVSYQLYLGATATGGLQAGTGFALSFGAQCVAGTYYVMATNPVTGCTSTSNTVSITTCDPCPPCPISGSTVVCVGQASTYTTLCPGGTWSGSDDSLASIGIATGILTAHSAGTYVVTYSTPSGCTYTYTLTISTLPVISGPYSICVGSTVDMGDDTCMMWSSSNSSVASVGAATGVVGGLTAGNATITVTSCSGCFSTQVVTINPQPSPVIVSGGGTYCGSATIVASAGYGGTIYFQGTTSGGTSTSTPATSMTVTTPGTYYFRSRSASGCWGLQGSAVVMINPLPTVCTLTGGGTACDSACPEITLTCSNLGVSYQLYQGATGTGAMLSGTGSALSFGAQCMAGTYSVMATNSITGCTNASNTVVITSCTACPPCPISGPVTMCAGDSYTYTDECPGGTWSVSNSSVGVINVLSGIFNSSGVGVQTITYNVGSCVNVHVVTINPLPALVTVSGGGTFCGSADIYATGGTGGMIYFQGTTSMGTSTATPTTTMNVTASGTYYFRAMSASGCWGAQGSVVVTINDLPAPVSVTGGGAFCTSATLLASNGGSGTIYYQGTTSGGTSPVNAINPQTVSASGIYYFRARAGNGCWGIEGSAAVIINPTPAVVTVSGARVFCGSTVITAIGGAGGTIYFQGTSSGGTSTATPSVSEPVSASGTYYFRSMSASGCWGPQGSVTVTINPGPDAVSVTGGGTYCGSAVLTATGGTGGNIYFQGTTSGGTSTSTGTLTSTKTVTASGTYYFRSRSASGCWGAEGSVTVVINPLPGTVSVTGGGSSCGSATLNASGGSGGMIYFQGLTSGGMLTDNPGSSFTVATTGMYYFRALSADGCWGAEAGSSVTISALPTAVTVTGGGAGCGSSTLLATNGGSGNIYYQGTTSGGTSAATPATSIVVSTSGTYYFRARLGTCWGPEGSATVSVSGAPSAVTVSGGGTFCGSATLTAAGGAGGTIYFQGTTSGGTATDNPGATQAVTATGTYYFRSMSAGGCWGPEGSTVVVVTPAPGAVTVTGGGTFCGSAVLTASNDGVGLIFWEGTTNNGMYATTQTTTQTVSASGTYYFRAKSGACWSTQGSATVTIKPLPSAITGSLGLCVSGNTDLNCSSAGSGWSSDNTAIATVSAGGLVQSVAGAGTATISYTGTNGCARTVEVTVSVLNPNAGVPVICMGSMPSSIAILTNDAPGGVWSSLHPTKALISGSSGATKGVGLGTATIVYTLGSCSTSTTVTVNGAVAAISGLSSVHQSMSIPLSCTTPLGAWSSSNGNAIVDPGSGMVTGVNTGGATISYIVNPGCYKTKDVTVLAGRPEMPEESAGVAVEFAVYPNPSAGNMVLSSPVTGNMTIYTMDGKVVQQFVITESVTPLTLPQGLATGIYMCRFAGSDGVVKMVKLVYEP